jgi:hypothetical protein
MKLNQKMIDNLCMTHIINGYTAIVRDCVTYHKLVAYGKDGNWLWLHKNWRL